MKRIDWPLVNQWIVWFTLGTATLLALGFLAVGCAMPPVEFKPVPDAPDGTRIVIRRAVVAGLTFVDPRAYNGWDGACPGCDIDSELFAQLCRDNGIEASLHQNRNATKAKLTQASRAAWKDMKAGDLFIFYISGHGGQIDDISGDEVDRQDETLCLWDGELSDDYLSEMWDEMPVGIRVLFITDTCNSGTNYKARDFRRTAPKVYKGSMIHYGGCDDGKSSYGSEQGGVFTTALIDAWTPGIAYKAWFIAADKLMPRNQIPIYDEYGNVTEAFRDGPALQ